MVNHRVIRTVNTLVKVGADSMIIDGTYLLPVAMYMERLKIPYARLRRPTPKNIILVSSGEDDKISRHKTN